MKLLTSSYLVAAGLLSVGIYQVYSVLGHYLLTAVTR